MPGYNSDAIKSLARLVKRRNESKRNVITDTTCHGMH
jgi:hypothetical protein